MKATRARRWGGFVALGVLLNGLGCGRLTADERANAGGGEPSGGANSAGETSSGGGGTATGGGGTATGGAAGSRCSGEPACSKGAVECDGETGLLTECSGDACGTWVGTSTPCVRELVMDQESNVACVIRGARDMICFTPGLEGVSPTQQLPEDTTTLVLPDDANNVRWGERAPRCALSKNGTLRCLRLGSEVTKENCSAAALSDQGEQLLCTTCNGVFACEGTATGTPAAVESFAVGDGQYAYLEGGAIVDPQKGGPVSFGGLTRLFRSDVGDLCGLGDGGVRCVMNSGGDTFQLSVPLVEASLSAHGLLCGVDANHRGLCVPVRDSTGKPELELERIRRMATSASTACALGFDGSLRCFSGSVELDVPSALR